MALPSLSRNEVATMNEKELENYFNNYAGYFDDSPNLPYAIRVGSRSLFGHDPYELKCKFMAYYKIIKKEAKNNFMREMEK